MKVLKWSLLGVTLLLLVCQVTVSQLCKSMTVLMDGFHTLFILISIALASDAAIRAPPDPPPELLASPLHASNLCAESPVTKPRLGTRTLRQICPPALGCGLSYKQCRVPIVGSFVSALVLASLCLSSTIDIIGLFLEPRQVWLPLPLLVISSYSVLLKMLFLWLYWDQFSDVSLPSRGGNVRVASHGNTSVTFTTFWHQSVKRDETCKTKGFGHKGSCQSCFFLMLLLIQEYIFRFLGCGS